MNRRRSPRPPARTARDLSIRRVLPGELDPVRRLVSAVVEEVYGSLFPMGVPDDDSDWRAALVALSGKTLVGVVLTSEDTIDDLWVAADYRRRGVGRALLVAAESEIRQRNYPSARLRVVAKNAAARRFYAAHYWREVATFRHERWGFPTISMTKDLTQ